MSKIEWTQETLSLTTGCTPISSGCTHCWGRSMTRRLQGAYDKRIELNLPPGKFELYRDGFDRIKMHRGEWVVVERWKTPRRVFVCPMSDLFHEKVPDSYIREGFQCMALCPQHTFQVFTKRSDRPLCLESYDDWEWPPNVWMGVSVENEEHIDRIGHLAMTGAAVKGISFEPLLGPIGYIDLSGIDWAIIGCESGSGARPMKDIWAERLIENCEDYGLAIFYKQQIIDGKKVSCPEMLGRQWMEYPEARL